MNRQYLHAKNKPKTGDGFDFIYYCNECGIKEVFTENYTKQNEYIVTDECFWIDNKPEDYNPSDPNRKPHFTTLVDMETGSITKLGSGSRVKIIQNTYVEGEGKIQ